MPGMSLPFQSQALSSRTRGLGSSTTGPSHTRVDVAAQWGGRVGVRAACVRPVITRRAHTPGSEVIDRVKGAEVITRKV